jgi:hypothetical protein
LQNLRTRTGLTDAETFELIGAGDVQPANAAASVDNLRAGANVSYHSCVYKLLTRGVYNTVERSGNDRLREIVVN